MLTPFLLIFSKALLAESFISNGEGLKEILFSNPLEFFKQIRLTGREILWFLAFKGFLKNPLFGNGLGYSNLLIKTNTVIIEQVHNDYLKLMSDVGIIGLLLYINLFTFMVYQAIKIYKANPETKFNFSLFVSTVIQIMIFSMTDNVISYGPYVLIYVFISYTLLVRSNGENLYESRFDNELLHPLQI
jgi:O-antigen ligase